MASYEENIATRLDSEVKPRERAENATMVAIGGIADTLERIANALDRIAEVLSERKHDH